MATQTINDDHGKVTTNYPQVTGHAAAERAAAIARLVDQAPPLTGYQIATLSRIFAGTAEQRSEAA